jgi:osmotically-inducible protein OsmY
MPRALPGVIAVLLAIAVVVPAPRAPAQILGRFRRQQTPVQKGHYEIDAILSDEHQRLAEMKVELALLGDIATFPYEFAARANGKTLVLRGNVPNDMVRQRAMDLARSNTFLRGIDELRIQANLGVRSTLRPPGLVQQEGMELLLKELGAPAKNMSLEVRPNGVVVLTGHIDCMESKLEISRLFRRLPGCTAIINDLTVEPILLDGQRMVRVTRNNMLLVPPSALTVELGPATRAERQRAVSPATAYAPTQTNNSLAAQEGELSLPTAPSSQPGTAAKPASSLASQKGKDKKSDWALVTPSKLPVKWGHPAESWETQMSQLDSEPARPQGKQLRLDPKLSRPAQTVWTRSFSEQSKPGSANDNSRSRVVVKQEAPEPAMTWRRPGGSEEAETKVAPAATEPPAPASDSEKAPAPAVSSLSSSRRWPPAYVTGPPPSQGRLGVISFEDDPPPNPAPAVIATSRALTPADLQRQIKSICGRQAREVTAITQKDGSILVRVKVADRSSEDQLSRRILALPEMSSQRVRLMMEIVP